MPILVAVMDPAAVRDELVRFTALLSVAGVREVRVWCSYNPELPDDSPLQSPRRVVPPEAVVAFFDAAVQAGVWTYGDVWNRAGIEALDGSFDLFLGNDRQVQLETDDRRLLDPLHSAWTIAGYWVRQYERSSRRWRRRTRSLPRSRRARPRSGPPRARPCEPDAWCRPSSS